MKWGKLLQKEALWKWRTSYINYKKLKQIIKQLRQIKSKEDNKYDQLCKDFFTRVDQQIQGKREGTKKKKIHTFIKKKTQKDIEMVEKFYWTKKTKLVEQTKSVLKMFDHVLDNSVRFRKENIAATLCVISGLSKLLPQLQQMKVCKSLHMHTPVV
ncbi:hypothetical protein RFI_27843 [Reticulomyxa filosa]|uniref:SPX domain-containing protein n=1 Tax=Reticulomyxa filosa TaxID=46433 RepID=X6M933_RETFI|nr:hypothetical protein RFI_27843 [Reticulomyxa filosa]|eukprot:ETO09535.1 hypothetical protein RFI_27843 [Reticulomyxa filosa]